MADFITNTPGFRVFGTHRYQSEAAFQRAFKSHMGITPAQWRKTQEPSGQDVFARLAVLGDAFPIKADGGKPTDGPRLTRGGDAPD